jgi:sec-independent protein translocase protein TatA
VAGLGAPEMLIVLAVMLLLFGGSQLPKLARSLGSAKREFESAQHELERPSTTRNDAA